MEDWWVRYKGTLSVALLSSVLYALLAIAYTYPLITHLGSGILRGLDTEDALQQTWVVAWVQHALLSHPAALFNAPIFSPRATRSPTRIPCSLSRS